MLPPRKFVQIRVLLDVAFAREWHRQAAHIIAPPGQSHPSPPQNFTLQRRPLIDHHQKGYLELLLNSRHLLLYRCYASRAFTAWKVYVEPVLRGHTASLRGCWHLPALAHVTKVENAIGVSNAMHTGTHGHRIEYNLDRRKGTFL